MTLDDRLEERRREFPTGGADPARERIVLAALDAVIRIEREHAEILPAFLAFEAGQQGRPALARILDALLNQSARAAGFASYDALMDEAESLGLVSFRDAGGGE